MFAAIARFSIRRRRFVLGGFALLAVVAAVFGGSVAKSLRSGGFNDPNSESSRAEAKLAATFGAGNADVIALYSIPAGTMDDAVPNASIKSALDRAAADPSVQGVTSLFNTGATQFESADHSQTYAVITLRGDDSQKADALKRLRPLLQANGVQTRLGGVVPAGVAIQDSVSSDLERSELIAFPVTAVLLVVVFGSLTSAGIPLALGGLAIILAFLVLRILAAVTSVSVFALNVITTLGLGLAIDYSLFILSRYREELPRRGREGAIVTAISTTGRAVAFSGLTLAASLAGLFLFPQSFLRSMAMGGIAVALLAVTLALTVLPALIAMLGHRTESLRVPWYRDAANRTEMQTAGGFWHRIAMAVMRRPVLISVAIIAVLLGAASPFLRFRGSTPDVRVLPASVEARQVSDVIGTAFQPNETTPQDVLVSGSSPFLTPQGISALYDYVARLAAVAGVAQVNSVFSLAPGLSRDAYVQMLSLPNPQQPPALAAGIAAFVRGDSAKIAVISQDVPDSLSTQAQVNALRSVQPPAGSSVLVGGQAAQLSDLKQALKDRVPLALGFVAVVMFVVLFLVFGSVTLPLKAMLMNLLSLSASYGAMVWIFQDGRLQSLLRFTSLGTVDATQPILMFAIVFGLSMDYEVLMLSRIREEYVRTGDNTAAVALGLEKTGRLITSAAALLVVVFGAFATASLVFMKQLGVGMTLAIALDATIVRALLVPATMRLLGRWNWWAPRPLLELWRRVGLGDLEGRGAHGAAPQPAAGD